MKKMIFLLMGLLLGITAEAKVDNLYMVTGDRLPYYTIQIVDADDDAVDISATTITATVENVSTGQEIVSDGSVNITNGPLGYAELRWPDASTNTAGTYAIQFRVLSGGLYYTVPAAFNALVIISDNW